MPSVPPPCSWAWHSGILSVLCLWEHPDTQPLHPSRLLAVNRACGWQTQRLTSGQQTQGKNGRKNSEKKCHPPSQLDPKTKELLCFNSCSHRPSLAREEGHWWGRNAIKSQVPSFQSWVVVSLLPPTGQLQHELLPKPTVKFNLHSLQEKKKSLSLPGILLWCKSCRLWHASHIHTRCEVGGGVSRWSFSVEQALNKVWSLDRKDQHHLRTHYKCKCLALPSPTEFKALRTGPSSPMNT